MEEGGVRGRQQVQGRGGMRRREDRQRKLALEVVSELIKAEMSGGESLIGAVKNTNTTFAHMQGFLFSRRHKNKLALLKFAPLFFHCFTL